jgi:uncharacterized integral membrane protein
MAHNDPTREPDPADVPEEDATSGADDTLADSTSDETTETAADETPSTDLVPHDEAGELAESDEPVQDRPGEPTKHVRPPQPELHRQTRIGAAWVALAVGVVILILLLIFIFKNNESTPFWLFGLTGQMPLGVLLLFAACGGALIVIVLGVARILQMRILARRDRRSIKN